MTSYLHHLITAPLEALKPTQITVGLAEVAKKRAEWAALKPKERKKTLAAHCFPGIRGPGGRWYVIDHHHLGLALHEEDVDQVWVHQLDDLSSLDVDVFWRVMEFHRWTHPFDAKGQRCAYKRIPSHFSELRDDPYRSLAGFVREAGGYAKDAQPYAEFLWADFFRERVSKKAIEASGAGRVAGSALQEALGLAHAPLAKYLPGWMGVIA